MELTILGGSAATPNGGDASAGYLLATDRATLLIDCGSGVVAQLRAQIDARALSGIVISHLHSDHTLDLVALRYSLRYAPPGPGEPIPLYLPPGGLDFLERLSAVFAFDAEQSDTFWTDVFLPQEYSDYQDGDRPLTIGDLTLRFAPMYHYVPVWAIRIEQAATGRALTYSADTGPSGPLAGFAAGSDLLLCEATLLQQAEDDPSLWGHLTAREAGEIATEAGVGRLVLTHMWAELGFDNYLAQASQAFAGHVDLAHAGKRFTI